MELVSVIMPMYNSQKYIEESVKSVMMQTYSNWELIIVDDCSIDLGCNIIENIQKKDERIKLIKLEKNLGPANARNVAINNAKGRFIAFLDSDDIWRNNKLEVQINYMISREIAVSFTSYEILFMDRKEIRSFSVPDKISYNDLFFKNYMSCDTVIIDKKYLKNFKFYNFDRHEDYLTWLKLLKESKVAYGINQNLATYRVSKGSRSSSKFKNVIPLFNIFFKEEKLNFIKSLYYTARFSINSIKKYS